MTRITKQNFLINKFSRSNTNKILKILNNFVLSTTTPRQLSNQTNKNINSLTQQADQFCWYVGSNPAYHIQYQVDSVAILRINNFIIIVWKPKYIQYPNMVQFPDFNNQRNQNIRITIDQKLTNITEGNINALIQFIILFISTYYKKDDSFQTDLVTYVKHYISKRTALSYWHCIYDDDNQMALKNMEKMRCIAKLHISGVRKNYNKCLFIFSCQGQRDNIFKSIGKKWMQAISFLAMVMIFVSVVSCSHDQTEGICKYRDQAMVGGAGLMMALFGVKLANRKKKKAAVDEKEKGW